jgi:hypothetical protein
MSFPAECDIAPIPASTVGPRSIPTTAARAKRFSTQEPGPRVAWPSDVFVMAAAFLDQLELRAYFGQVSPYASMGDAEHLRGLLQRSLLRHDEENRRPLGVNGELRPRIKTLASSARKQFVPQQQRARVLLAELDS